MIVKEIEFKLNYQKLLDEIYKLNIFEFLNKNSRQMAIQHRGLLDKNQQLIESCQSLTYDWDKFDQNIHTEPPVRDTILNEHDFDQICDFFKDTYIEELTNNLMLQYKVYRGRFMLMKYKTCLSVHTDNSPRLHIPIITNSDSFMVVNDIIYKLELNKTYIVDTRLPHTAVNAGKKDRLHLVFCIPNNHIVF